MAFLFNGYQTTDDSENAKQNIFAAGPNTQAEGGTGGQNDVLNKTSGDGSTVSGSSVSRGTSPANTGGSSSGSQMTSSGSGGYNPKAVQSAYSKIGQSLQLPTQSIGKAQGAIQTAQQNLQTKANEYAAAGQQQAQSYKLDSDTINKAVKGDDTAFQTTAKRLQSARPDVEAFKGLGADLPDVSGIRDATKAYADEAGPNYSAGQSRFDAALLRRNPEYLKLQQQILGDAAKLRQENDKAVEEKTAQQRAALENAYNESTTDIRKQLEGLGSGIVDAARQKETAEDARRAALSESEIAAQEYAKLREKIRADLSSADPRSQQYRAAQYLDSLSPDQLSQYVNIDRDTDWREFIDQGGADQYNRAMGLLGRGDMLTAAGAAGAGPDYGFDEGNAYRTILDQITGKRAEADRVGQEEMDRIIQAAQERASQYNQRDSGQTAKEAAMKALAAYGRQKYGTDERLGDLAQLHAQDLFQNPELYQKLLDQGLVRENTGADWRSVLLTGEAQRLNALGADLGGLEQYTAGGYRDEFDEPMLQKYYDEYIAPYMQKYQTPAPVPVPASGGSGTRSKNVLRLADVR